MIVIEGQCEFLHGMLGCCVKNDGVAAADQIIAQHPPLYGNQ